MATGDFGAILDEKLLVSAVNGLARTSIAHATEEVSCVVFGSVPTASIEITLATFSINPTTGLVSDVLDSVIVATVASTNAAGHVVRIIDGIVAVAVNNITAGEIQVYTFSIASDGTITAVDSLVSAVAPMGSARPGISRVTDTLLAVAYVDQGASKNEVITVDVDGVGNLGSVQDTQVMDRVAENTQNSTVALNKVREPDIWAMGESDPGSTGDTYAATFTINEATGAISAPIDAEVFDLGRVICNEVVSFLSTESDGQFVIAYTNNNPLTRARRLVSYQVDGAADLGVDLDIETIATGGGVSHGGALIYLGDRVVLHQQDGSAGKRTFSLDAGGIFSAVDTDSASAHTPVWSYLMHPSGFGNRMVISYGFGGGDPHDIFISTFDLENSLAGARQRAQIGYGLIVRNTVG